MSQPPWLSEVASCASTNTWALERLDSLVHGSVVFTRRQTGGRGRGGRPWASPPGVLTASVVIDCPQPRGLALAAGLAVVHAVEDRCPGLGLAIKWPNDVVLAGRKLAGVLCEGAAGRWVVGIGLNLTAELPEALAATATSLHRHVQAVPPALELLADLRGYLLEGAGLLAARGLAALLPQLRTRDALLGRSVAIESRAGRIDGTGAGLDEQGRLLVVVPHGGVAAVDAGHVVAW